MARKPPVFLGLLAIVTMLAVGFREAGAQGNLPSQQKVRIPESPASPQKARTRESPPSDQKARASENLPPDQKVTGQETLSPEQAHEQLRALKERAVDAVNKHSRDELFKELAPDVTFTAMNNDVVHGLDKVQAYYDLMLTSSGRLIEDMLLIRVEADELSHLYANNQVAVASGKADAHFKLVTGKEFEWPLRWTATLTRNDSKWSIVDLHFSANAIDNPLLAAATSTTLWTAATAGLGGLVIGYVIVRFRRRPVSAS